MTREPVFPSSGFLLVAGTLFGIFFGAPQSDFPVHLGQLAGRQFLRQRCDWIYSDCRRHSDPGCCRDRKHAFGGLQDPSSRRVGHR